MKRLFLGDRAPWLHQQGLLYPSPKSRSFAKRTCSIYFTVSFIFSSISPFSPMPRHPPPRGGLILSIKWRASRLASLAG